MTAAESTNADERLQALLDERSARLARRRIGEEASVRTEAFLVCVCGSERLGLAVKHAGAVLPLHGCTRLPGAPSGLRGIVALSGRIVTVIDLAAAIGLAPSQGEAPSFLVRLRAQEPALALAVDRLVGVVEVDPGRIGQGVTRLGSDILSGYAAPGSSGSGPDDEGFAVVDLPRLLRRFLP